MAATHSIINGDSNGIKHYTNDVLDWEINATNVPTLNATYNTHIANVTTAHGFDTVGTTLANHLVFATAHDIDDITANLGIHAGDITTIHGMAHVVGKVVTWAGAFVGNTSNLSETVFHDMVTLKCSHFALHATDAAATATLPAGSIDAAYCPAVAITMPAGWINDNSTIKAGYVTINANGSVTLGVGPTQAAFAFGAGEQGRAGFQVTYAI